MEGVEQRGHFKCEDLCFLPNKILLSTWVPCGLVMSATVMMLRYILHLLRIHIVCGLNFLAWNCDIK